MRRDIAERGRDYTSVLRRYNKFVKKDFEDYVKPFMKYADIIIPGGANNDSKTLDNPVVGLQFIYENLLSQMKKMKRRNSFVEGVTVTSNLLDLVLSKSATFDQNSSFSNLFYSYNPNSHSFFLLKGLKQEYDLQFFK